MLWSRVINPASSINEIRVLGMPANVLSDEGASRNHAITLGPRVVQRRCDQVRAHASAFESRRHFCVGEGNGFVFHLVLRDSD